MKLRFIFLFLTFVLAANWLSAQTDSLTVKEEKVKVEKKEFVLEEYDPLAPSKAAFYSAVLPGLGQAYTKKYWKIPLVYAGLGAGVYFYIDNNNKYHEIRDIYKRRLAGYEDDKYQGIFTNQNLIDGQREYQRNKEISLLFTIGWYIINIIDANVTAHLQQFNVSENLSLRPQMRYDEISGNANFGLSLNFNISK